MTSVQLATAVPSRAWLQRLARLSAAIAIAVLAPLAALVLWAAASAHAWLPPQILPAPAEVWQAIREMSASGELQLHAAISLRRVVYGFSVGAALGLALGIAIGLSTTVEDYVKPLFTAFAQIPTLGWIPLLMLLAGIGETLKIIVIAKAAFVPIVLNTAAGIRGVPQAYVEVAQVFRFSRTQLLRKVVLPGAIPPIFTGVRYGLTHAWMALVAVELLASSEGLGYLLVWGRQMFWLDTVIVAMIVIGAVGFIMDRTFASLESSLQRWRFAGQP